MITPSLYQRFVRPLMFRLDPEDAHHMVFRLGAALQTPGVFSLVKACAGVVDPRLTTTVAAIEFKSPLLLAAGFDKDCRLVPLLTTLGFGGIEIGTVTAQAQPGNPRPRIFRLPQDQGLINRMGFPSRGAREVAVRLARVRQQVAGFPLGINIGKSKVTPIEDAAADYLESFRQLAPLADFVVINVSSPNTPGLRALQERDKLEAILRAVQAENQRAIPVFLKLAPDLNTEQLDDALDCALRCKLAAIVATNTTIGREGLKTTISESGGLSGAPLRARALQVVSHLYRQSAGRIPIIGVGGISSADDVIAMLRAGAHAVQIYSALIYYGPGLVRSINDELRLFIEREGIQSIQEIVGSASSSR